MKFAHPLVTNALLAAIVIVLALIWRRMPPTYGEKTDADNPDERMAILSRTPVVVVDEPLKVEIGNEPIKVEVQ